ncbi:hypothetical protein L873DRAFT_177752 [Choiromyces venosus 120613-1]|uniref:Uncharacterized protein n=1 Tax=Choiromyces venosus 120613-1 TaxID=1336337 RepID=A0A3N4KCB8_9PEZI|nr:hypothetical protein L873DRAFT_177752 [Choiromyces venosus 120613-1]
MRETKTKGEWGVSDGSWEKLGETMGVGMRDGWNGGKAQRNSLGRGGRRGEDVKFSLGGSSGSGTKSKEEKSWCLSVAGATGRTPVLAIGSCLKGCLAHRDLILKSGIYDFKIACETPKSRRA